MEAANYEILRVAESRNSQEESVKRIGEVARRYLDEMKEL
jgi:hypothetical protein